MEWDARWRNRCRGAQLYDRANAALGYDLAKLCFEGPAEQLDSTVYSQPALFVTSLARSNRYGTKPPTWSRGARLRLV